MLKNGFHKGLAESFVDSIRLLRNNYYYFLGKTTVWNPDDIPPNDTTVITNESNTLIRTDSLFYKKIQPSDVSFVCNRYDWTSGNTYIKYDHTIDLRNLPFYVCVWNSNAGKYFVYKCLDNNNHSPSTQKPSGNDIFPVTYSDGYTWKYMYSISQALMNSFSTSNKIPVKNALSNYFYNKGPISSIYIFDGGSGYTSNTTISIVGDGTGATATPIITNGVITDIQITNGGSGYTYASISVVSAGKNSGTDSILRAIIDTSSYVDDQSVIEQTTIPGAIHCININNGGTLYSPQTTISIVGDGTGATATPIINVNGSITKIVMSNIGMNYSYANIVINDPNRNGISGAVDFSGYAIISPFNGHGKNAIEELGATEIMISSAIPLMTFQNANDFRQYGIVKNIKYKSSGKSATISEELVAYTVKLDTISGLLIDTDIVSNSASDTTSKYRVIYINSLTNEVILQPLTQNSGPPNSLKYNSNIYSVNSISKYPSLDKYSGDLVYVSNSTPFKTAQSQNITIQTLLKF